MAKKQSSSKKSGFDMVFPKVVDRGKTSLRRTAQILYPKGNPSKKNGGK